MTSQGCCRQACATDEILQYQYLGLTMLRLRAVTLLSPRARRGASRRRRPTAASHAPNAALAPCGACRRPSAPMPPATRPATSPRRPLRGPLQLGFSEKCNQPFIILDCKLLAHLRCVHISTPKHSISTHITNIRFRRLVKYLKYFLPTVFPHGFTSETTLLGAPETTHSACLGFACVR